MKNYICYLDLLGIKEIAKYSPEGYFLAMERFRNDLIISSKIFNKYSNVVNNVIFFSDSTFIQTDELKPLIDFIIDFRLRLTKHNALFFTCAITVGDLASFHLSGSENDQNDLPEDLRLSLEPVNKFVRGTIFLNEDVSKVYILQTSFKGIGVYVDEKVIENERDRLRALYKKANFNDNKSTTKANVDIENLMKYFTKPFYLLPSVKFSSKQYLDIALSQIELDSPLLENFLERYLNANTKNKKYGKYYVSYIANWILSEDYSKIQISYSEENNKNIISLINIPKSIQYLVTNQDIIIKELKSNAFGFDFLFFLLIEKLLNDRLSENDQVVTYLLNTILLQNKQLKKYFDKIEEIPTHILSSKNQDKFVTAYHRYLKTK